MLLELAFEIVDQGIDPVAHVLLAHELELAVFDVQDPGTTAAVGYHSCLQLPVDRMGVSPPVDDGDPVALGDQCLGELIDVHVLATGVGQAGHDFPLVDTMVGDHQHVGAVRLEVDLARQGSPSVGSRTIVNAGADRTGDSADHRSLPDRSITSLIPATPLTPRKSPCSRALFATRHGDLVQGSQADGR